MQVYRKPSTGARRGLDREAADLYRAMTALLRAYQYRDRDRMGYRGLSITQAYIFEALTRLGSLTLNALAAEMPLDKSTLSRAVDSLEAKRFVTRRANQADGRSTLLTPTVRGLARYRLLQRDRIEENARLLAGVPPAARREVIRFIDAMAEEVQSRRLEQIADR